MDAIVVENLKQDVQQERITADRLIEIIASQDRTFRTLLQQLQQQLQASQQRCAELEQKLGGPPTAKVDEPFSVRAEDNYKGTSSINPRDRRFLGCSGDPATP